MKKTTVNKLKKGDFFILDDYTSAYHELCFTANNAGGYGGQEGEGVTMFVLTKHGFEFNFHQIYRKNTDKATIIEPDDFKYFSEVEDRIRKTVKFVELYKVAEENSIGENLVGTYSNSAQYGKRSFSRGDIVKDCHGRIGIVLGVDGHSIAIINRVDYRVEVEDCGKKGVGIFRTDEITKIGKMDDITNLKE